MTDAEFNKAMTDLRKKLKFTPMTAAEAENELTNVEPIPISEELLEKIVSQITKKGEKK